MVNVMEMDILNMMMEVTYLVHGSMGSERGILGTQFYLLNFYLSKLAVFQDLIPVIPKVLCYI